MAIINIHRNASDISVQISADLWCMLSEQCRDFVQGFHVRDPISTGLHWSKPPMYHLL